MFDAKALLKEGVFPWGEGRAKVTVCKAVFKRDQKNVCGFVP
jgi:hypothetical protein